MVGKIESAVGQEHWIASEASVMMPFTGCVEAVQVDHGRTPGRPRPGIGACRDLLGWAPQDALGQPLTVLMPERYRAAHERGLARIEATGKGQLIGSVVELHGLRKSGEEFPIELSLATWKTVKGSYYSGIIRDISERKKAMEALKKLQHQHTLILTQAGEGIYGLDIEGNTTFVNPSAAAMLGYRPEDLIGRRMHHTLHHSRPDGTPYPAQDCPIHASIHDGQVHRVVDEVFWRKDNTSFHVEYVSTPIREGDHVIGAVIVFRDITARKQAESKLERQNQRLKALREIDTAILSADSVENIVGAALSHIRELIECRRASLALTSQSPSGTGTEAPSGISSRRARRSNLQRSSGRPSRSASSKA